MHYFGLNMDEILWGISWMNILMLTASIPSYDSKSSKKAGKEVSPNELFQQLNTKH